MTIKSPIPSSILDSLTESEETLREVLGELSIDKRKESPAISERALAEYLAEQMGYRGAGNVEALLAARRHLNKPAVTVRAASK